MRIPQVVVGAMFIGAALLPDRRGVEAASATLVISEVRTRGPGGENDEFIELRNVSSGLKILDGVRLVRANGSGDLSETLTALPPVALEPGCSWLLGHADGYSGPVDQTYVTGIDDNGGIAVVDREAIVDQVGLSVSTAFGEGTRLPDFGSSNSDRSYERTGPDTDDNAADFHSISPSTPQRGAGCVRSLFGPVKPVVESAAASPVVVGPGTETVFVAGVWGAVNPFSTGLVVRANTDAIGIPGGTVLLDDGTNGDALPGDQVFSRRVRIPADTIAGVKTIGVWAVDAQQRGSPTRYFTLTVVTENIPLTAAVVYPVNEISRQRPFGLNVGVAVTRGLNPESTGVQVTIDLSPLGGAKAVPLSDAGGSACDAIAGDLVFGACGLVVPRTLPIGPLGLLATVRDAQGRTITTGVFAMVTEGADYDADGLPDDYEHSFGLNPASETGDDGADGDPDHDGRTNAQEWAAVTNPRSFHRRYLAEGVTNAFFQTHIALFNPGDESTWALVRIQPEGELERAVAIWVGPHGRVTLTPEDLGNITSAPFATLVESDRELVIDRGMTWGTAAYGSHSETALHAASPQWFLAEGATGWRFSLFYLLQNPTDVHTSVEVTYLPGDNREPERARTYILPARQRLTIPVDDEEFPAGSGIKPLASTDVAASIRTLNGAPIVVERAMYMSPDGQPFGAGHSSAGVTASSTKWFFAEGATGSFFDMYLLLANPSGSTAHVTITYMPEGRAPIVRTYQVSGRSRHTIWVDQEPGLEQASLSASVVSTVPIVAERAMWWPGTGESWREAHVTAGATQTAARWAVADLELGGPLIADSYLLIQNGGGITLYFGQGGLSWCGATGAGRVTVHINECPGVAGERYVSAIVQGGSQTVVERATYYSASGLFAAGGAALATPIP